MENFIAYQRISSFFFFCLDTINVLFPIMHIKSRTTERNISVERIGKINSLTLHNCGIKLVDHMQIDASRPNTEQPHLQPTCVHLTRYNDFFQLVITKG